MRNVLLLVAILLLAGFGQAASTPTPNQVAQISLPMNPQPPAVADSTLSITVTRADHSQVSQDFNGAVKP